MEACSRLSIMCRSKSGRQSDGGDENSCDEQNVGMGLEFFANSISKFYFE
jgi:hypothetical protein